MPSYVEQLTTARDQIAAQIVTLTVEYSPDSNLDGQGAQHGAQLERLTAQLERLNRLINQANPYSIVTQVV